MTSLSSGLSPPHPQALHYKKYSTASDVWSFGCVMYEIWSLGHKPFEHRTNDMVRSFGFVCFYGD